jgi:hypothetical protein
MRAISSQNNLKSELLNQKTSSGARMDCPTDSASPLCQVIQNGIYAIHKDCCVVPINVTGMYDITIKSDGSLITNVCHESIRCSSEYSWDNHPVYQIKECHIKKSYTLSICRSDAFDTTAVVDFKKVVPGALSDGAFVGIAAGIIFLLVIIGLLIIRMTAIRRDRAKLRERHERNIEHEPRSVKRGAHKLPSPEVAELENQECMICHENKKNIALVPCGHMQFCSACVRKLRQDDDVCPVCHGEFDDAIHVII